VSLLDPASVADFRVTIGDAYRAKFGIDPAFYPVRPAEGASRLS